MAIALNWLPENWARAVVERSCCSTELLQHGAIADQRGYKNSTISPGETAPLSSTSA